MRRTQSAFGYKHLCVPFAFAVAVGDVGFEDLTIVALKILHDGSLVDCTGTAVVGECTEID